MLKTVDIPLNWSRDDLEQRLGARGGRYTRVNSTLTFLMGLSATALFYAALIPAADSQAARMFRERGPTPYAIVFFSCWALAILFVKSRKLALQRRALDFPVVPAAHDFVLSGATVDQVVDQVYRTVDDPKHFLLFNRIVIALSNLRNLGRVADVDDILRSQGEQEQSSLETSYALIQGFVWAIPVLGFIGTVLGLSEAIGGFGAVLAAAADVSQLTDALRGVTAGLSTAFDTTLQALAAALAIQLLLTVVKKSEEEFLDACAEYCTRHVVGRLRVLPFEREAS